MMKYVFWEKPNPLRMANGALRTYDELVERYPFAEIEPVVLGMSGPKAMSFNSLSVLVDQFGIDETLTDDEKLAAIVVELEQLQSAGPGSTVDPFEEIKELQYVTLEGIAATNEEQAANNEQRDQDIMTLFAGLADMMDIVLEIADRMEV